MDPPTQTYDYPYGYQSFELEDSLDTVRVNTLLWQGSVEPVDTQFYRNTLAGNRYNVTDASPWPQNGAALATERLEHQLPIQNLEEGVQMQTAKSTKDGKRVVCEETDCGQSFARKADLKRHYSSIHDPCPVYCGCCDNEGSVHYSPRMDKFLEHQRKFHKRVKPIKPFLCPMNSCLKERCSTKHIVAFGTEDSLHQHFHRKHNSGGRNIDASDRFCEDLSSTSSTSMEDSSLATSVLSEHRSHLGEAGSVKRARFDDFWITTEQSSPGDGSSYPQHETCDHSGNMMPWPSSWPGEVDIVQSTHLVAGTPYKDSTMCSSSDAGDLTQPTNDSRQTQDRTSDLLTAQRHSDARSPIIPTSPRRDVSILTIDFEELSIHDVRPAEYFTLSRLKVLCYMETTLKSSIPNQGQDNSAISFSIADRTIKLRGSKSVAPMIRGQLELNLEEIRNNTFKVIERIWEIQHAAPPRHIQPVTAKVARPQYEDRISERNFPLRREDDLILLSLWVERILPILPKIMAESVGDTYSATLLRQGLSNESSIPIIQIQTSRKPSWTVQRSIESRLKSVFGGHPMPNTRFLQGSFKPLAGNLDEDDDKTMDNSFDDFPHYKLYWPHPGLSASIGMRCTRKISATSCCYLDVDGKKLLLTVRHFIEDSKAKRDSIATQHDERTLTSPALLEVDRMIEFFDQYLRELDTQIDEALKERYRTELPSNIECSDTLKGYEENKGAAWRLKDELLRSRKDEKTLILGSLMYETKASAVRPIDEETTTMWPESTHRSPEPKHRMDWSLWHVTNRAGVNRTQYGIDHVEGSVDFANTENGGTRRACHATHSVESNERVYWIGQSSGYQVADVNPAPMQIVINGVETMEWSLIVQGKYREGHKKFRGDSGAGIMRVSDDSLIGMLCAYCNQQLVFTPIRGIIADIKEKCNARNVKLWPIYSEGIHTPFTGSPENPPTDSEAILISRDVTEEIQKPIRIKPSDLSRPIFSKRFHLQKTTVTSISVESLEISGNSLLTERGSNLGSPIPSLSSSLSEQRSDSETRTIYSSDDAQSDMTSRSPQHHAALTGGEGLGFPILEKVSSQDEPQMLCDDNSSTLADAMNTLSIDQFLADRDIYHPMASVLLPQRRSSTWPPIAIELPGLKETI